MIQVFLVDYGSVPAAARMLLCPLFPACGQGEVPRERRSGRIVEFDVGGGEILREMNARAGSRDRQHVRGEVEQPNEGDLGRAGGAAFSPSPVWPREKSVGRVLEDREYPWPMGLVLFVGGIAIACSPDTGDVSSPSVA